RLLLRRHPGRDHDLALPRAGARAAGVQERRALVRRDRRAAGLQAARAGDSVDVMRAAALAAFAAVWLAGVDAVAQPIDTAGMVACRVRGYATDTDPKGTNVRSAPRADAQIVGRLAPLKRVDRETVEGVEFAIIGSMDGWLLITDADYGGLTFD